MSILVNEDTRVVVQGITGSEGGFHAKQCIGYGTKVVAGVTPGRGGQLFDGNVPVFDSMEQAVRETDANTSLIFVPAAYATDAVIEAADSGVGLVVCITEGIPVMDMVRVIPYLDRRGVRLIGPNCPGVISPGARCKIGIMPGGIHLAGRAGVVSRSGTLTYEGRVPAYAARNRPVYLRRHWRRPPGEHQLCGHIAPLPRGPGDRHGGAYR